VRRKRRVTSPDGISLDGIPQIYPNDPDAPGGLVPATPVAPGSGEPRFVIEGPRYAPAAYAPGTLAFQYWQGEIALARTIRVWEDLFDRDFDAWQGGATLAVKLRAGRDLNAFYDRKSLQFFYDVDRATGRTVYAVESLDIVAHEAGHAILDVYQPGYWSSVDLETASFHEAFGDCSALVTTLADPAVRRSLLDETAGAPARSNLVSRLAEALGRAIHDNFGPEANSDPTRLRDAHNTFRYAPPSDLKPGTPEERIGPEPHSFSRIFTGAFYDALAACLARELKREPDEGSVERARRLLGRLLARAVETSPPGEARFADLGARMREIDQTEEGGLATAEIERAFASHGMPLPRLGTVAAGRSRRRGRPASAFRALRSLDPDLPGGTSALRASLGLPAGARLSRKTLPARVGGGVREQLSHEEWVEVRHPALGTRGRPGKALIRITCGCTIVRDPAGDVEGATIAPRPHPTPAELARRIRPWIAMDAIERGGRRDVRDLFRERKPFRVARSGVLDRVYFD
jgi:hypothetical protein